ncbi:MAG: GAF domain-containing protein [Deltaproteobacteria bacterium]|nr:GAF domain-containing protein [Deltaproteobacteria bacterium]
MQRFGDISIRRKLTLIIMATSGAALLLAGASFLVYDSVAFPQAVAQNLSSLAVVIGNNSAAAIVFDDENAANEILAALRATPNVVSGYIYRKDRTVFARYARAGWMAPPQCPTQFHDYRVVDKHVEVCRPILFRGEMLGTIGLKSDLREWQARLWNYGQIVVAILALSLVVAFAVSAVLQRVVSTPLLSLARLARNVSNEHDYSVRASKTSQDEIGVLVDGFNDMLGQIQQHLKRVTALHDINLAVTSTLDLRDVLNILFDKIDLFLSYSVATIGLLNKQTGLLEPVACRNLDEKEWRAEEWKGGRGSANEVLKAKEPLLIPNCQTDPRIRDPEFYRRNGLVSYLGVPLIFKDEILGVLSFHTKKEYEFHNDQIEFLSTLAGQAAIAINNSRLYEEMTELAADLSKSNKVKDEFLSVMSHELRTPLNVVMGYVAMIKDGLYGSISPEQQEALEKVMSRARDQLTMITGILHATQIEAERVGAEVQPFSLRDFLDDLRSSYEVRLEKDLAIHWNYSPDLPAITTDREKLKHILQNLINNAIKFTEKGRVEVSARVVAAGEPGAAPLPLADASREHNAAPFGTGTDNRLCWAEFTVADTGIGIPESALLHIFDKFHQADSSETRAYGGVGLGLYIVKQYAALLGGSVTVKSRPGKGSTFTLVIPYGTPEPEVWTQEASKQQGA